jgi:hypothetical protein
MFVAAISSSMMFRNRSSSSRMSDSMTSWYTVPRLPLPLMYAFSRSLRSSALPLYSFDSLLIASSLTTFSNCSR